MQATITYMLTESAQRAQMAATGQPVARQQVQTIEITADQFRSATQMLVVAGDGTLTADLTHEQHFGSHKVPGAFSDAPADGATAFSRRLAELRAAKQAYESDQVVALEQLRELHRQFLAGVAPEGVEAYRQTNGEPALSGQHIPLAPPHLPEADPLREALDKHLAAQESEQAARTEEKRRRQVELMDRFFSDPAARATSIGLGATVFGEHLSHYNGGLLTKDQMVALEEEAQHRKDADEASKERAKNEYIAIWFADPSHADPDTRQQFAEGLLSRSVALDLIAADAFAPYGLEEYAPFICRDRECACGRKNIETLPREIYPAFRALRSKLPEGTTLETKRVRECLRDENGYADEEDASEPVYAVNVKLPAGPFTFERLVRFDG